VLLQNVRNVHAYGDPTKYIVPDDALVAVLKKASGAVRVADIVKGVLSTGYRSTSANFRGIVNQALIKDKRFAKAGARGTYQLK